MALGIGNLFTPGNVTRTEQTTPVSGNSSVVVVPKGTEGALDLSVGNTVAGQIKDIQGDQVTLNLGNQNEMTAKMDTTGANLQVGQTVVFEVLSNQNNKLALSPLYTNLQANVTTAQNALKAASMPATDANMAMVTAMLKEGLSVDKSSLWNMSRLTTGFSQFQPSSVVELTAMGLPVNEGNLGQLEAYHNMNHQLMSSFQDISEGMNSLIRDFASTGQLADGIEFMKSVLSALSSENEANTVPAGQESTVAVTGEGAADANASSTVMEQATVANNRSAIQENAVPAADTSVTAENAAGSKDAEAVTVVARQAAEGELLNPAEDNTTVSRAETAKVQAQPQTMQASMEQADTVLKEALSSGDDAKLAAYIKEADPEILKQQLSSGLLKDSDVMKVFDALKQQIEQGDESAKGIFEDARKIFTKVFDAKTQDQWLLKPENFADKEKVQEFYQKLQYDVGKLTEALTNSGKAETQAGQAVSNLNQNLEFMQALNQAFPYIQIPLKTGLQNAHGDLYVYANKHKRISEDGTVSALLHLDMDHLGNLDVYLKLQDQKVQTHFYVEDDDTIDFLAANIHLLDERLAEKGYSVNSAVTGRPKPGEPAAEQDVVSRIRGENSEEKVISLSSFDAKA